MPKATEFILFDIDGTLLEQTGLDRYSTGQALKQIFGQAGPIEQFTMSGKTQPQIMKELMVLSGFSEEEIEAKLPRAYQVYIQILTEVITNFEIRPVAGIPELLAELQEQEGITLGLLTGNLEEVSKPKLQAAGIDNSLFPVGAYGNDHADRNRLPEIALNRMKNYLGRKIEPQQVVVLGDTPSDIVCARAGGMRVMAVATGNYSLAELSKYEPDYMFENTSNLESVLRALGLDGC